MILQRYCKTQNVVGHGVYIPRFLEIDLARILTSYLCLVRPLEILFLRVQCNDNVSAEYATYLWCKNMGRVSADSICQHFQYLMRRQNLDVGIRGYRHIAIGFARHHLKIPARCNEFFKLFDLQAAHSEKTGMERYGISHSDKGCSPELESDFYLISQGWQNLLRSR